MCLITFALKSHPNYPLVVVANRDEFYSRPTTTAHWWNDYPDILAGKDLKAGGSWFGMNKNGRFAAITNYRDPSSIKSDAPSRGDLVKNFLLGSDSPIVYLESLEASAGLYNGYNLLFGTVDDLYYFSNKSNVNGQLTNGIYGLSNHLLNTPWPKLLKVKDNLTEALLEDKFSEQIAFRFMQNNEVVPDPQLPKTGVPIEWERAISSIYIETNGYGTRCTTVLLVDKEGNVSYHEKSFVPEGYSFFEFKLKK